MPDDPVTSVDGGLTDILSIEGDIEIPGDRTQYFSVNVVLSGGSLVVTDDDGDVTVAVR